MATSKTWHLPCIHGNLCTLIPSPVRSRIIRIIFVRSGSGIRIPIQSRSGFNPEKIRFCSDRIRYPDPDSIRYLDPDSIPTGSGSVPNTSSSGLELVIHFKFKVCISIGVLFLHWKRRRNILTKRMKGTEQGYNSLEPSSLEPNERKLFFEAC